MVSDSKNNEKKSISNSIIVYYLCQRLPKMFKVRINLRLYSKVVTNFFVVLQKTDICSDAIFHVYRHSYIDVLYIWMLSESIAMAEFRADANGS